MNLLKDNIFFDLDGTLIDSKKRQYQLFSELAPESVFSFNDYWTIKRKRISQRELLLRYFNYSENKIEEFKNSWMKKIEDVERLKLDTPFPGVENLLNILSTSKSLYIVTARQSYDFVEVQLKEYGWLGYFDKILVTKQKESKASLVLRNTSVYPDNLFVGDTGEDILAGKKLGIKTVAVSSGVLNKQVLKTYSPDYLVSNVCAGPWTSNKF